MCKVGRWKGILRVASLLVVFMTSFSVYGQNYYINDTIQFCAGSSRRIDGQDFFRDTVFSRRYHDTLVTYYLIADTIRWDTVVTLCGNASFTVPRGGVFIVGNWGTYSDTNVHIKKLGKDPATYCWQILNYYIYSYPTYTITIDTNMCQGSAIYWGLDTIYAREGTYSFSYLSEFGCDSVVQFRVHVKDTFKQHFYDTICAGQTYRFKTGAFSRAGDYPFVEKTQYDCDSTLVLHLYVRDTIRDTIHPVICAGAGFDTNGHLGCVPVSGRNYPPYYRQGYYTQYLRSPDSCYVNLVIDLRVNDTLRDTIYPVICAGERFDTNGHKGCVPVSGRNYPSYSRRGVYTQYLRDTAAGCFQNLVIVLTVNDTFRHRRNATICAGRTYTIGDSTYWLSGRYPQHYSTVKGCDSTVVLALTVNDTIRDTVRRIICSGGRFDTNGVTYSSQGVYTQYLRQPDGCFNDLVVIVAVNDTLRDTVSRTICAGGHFDTNGQRYTTAGFYTQRSRKSDGCLHNLVIRLIVCDTFRTSRRDTICAGQRFFYEGVPHTTTQTFVYRHNARNGCDSNVVVHLFVKDTFHSERYDTVCAGSIFRYREQWYSTAGRHVYTHTAKNGCDSNVVIHLFLRDTSRSVRYDTVCAGNSFTYRDSTYWRTGSYRYVHLGMNGCDSAVIIRLTVKDTFRTMRYDTICAGEVFSYGGVSYVSSQTFVYRHTALNGCDSIVVVNLFVKDTSRTFRWDTICAGQVFTYEGVPYTSAQSFVYRHTTRNGCDSNVVVSLFVKDTSHSERYDTICAGLVFSYQDSGFFTPGRHVYPHTARNGCDSNVVVHLYICDTFRTERYDTVCRGNAFTYNGLLDYRTSNPVLHDTILIYRHSTVHDCDSNVVIHLHINDTFRTERYDTVCRGNVFEYGGLLNYLPASPILHDTVIIYPHRTALGCDSIVVIRLCISDTFRTQRSDTICRGNVFTYDGLLNYRPYNSSLNDTLITYLHQTIYGCDSTVSISLHIGDTFRSERYDTICAGEALIYEDSLYQTIGEHIYTHLARNGCDSNVVIHLHVNDTSMTYLYETICVGQTDTIGDSIYAFSGVYPQYYTSLSGCDSTVVLVLTVNDTIGDTIHPVICAGMRFDTNGHLGYEPVSGQPYPPYYRDSVYIQRYRTPDSCFYNLVIDLTVNDTLRDTIHPVICAGMRFDTNGHLGYEPVSGQPYPPYYREDVYTQRYRTPDSCYFNLVIDLSVSDTVSDTLHPVICAGMRFDTNGHLGYAPVNGQPYPPYYTQGVYTQRYRTPDSCYFNLVIDLSVSDTLRDTIHPVICAGMRFDTNGHLGYAPVSGQPYPPYYRRGVYTQRYRTPASCYFNLVIDLSVSDTLRDTIHPVICAGARFDTNGHLGYAPANGQNYGPYYRQGYYTQHLRTPDSCYFNLVIDLQVNDTLRDTIHPVICAGMRFDTNGHLGYAPANGQNYGPYYRQGYYTQHLRTPDSCYFNLVIDLRVNDTLRDTIHPIICAGMRFDTNGHLGYSPANGQNYGPYYRQGYYTQHLRTPDSCYFNLVIDLRVNDTLRDTIHPVICAGARFDTNGHLGYSPANGQNYGPYYLQGYHTQHMRTPDSCYFNLVIDLTVNDTLRDTVQREVCAGASFDTNGVSYYFPGYHTQHHRDPDSCFCNLVVNLVVRDTIRDTIHREVCFGATWDTNGVTYASTGYYTQYFRDSITMCYRNLVIHLIVDDPIITHIDRTICMGGFYLFNHTLFTSQGDYSFPSIAANGCDSTTILHLRVLDTTVTYLYDTIYNSYYAFMDTLYTRPGVYRHVVDRGLDGCDSIVILHLVLCDSLKTVIYDTVCNDSSYRFNGRILTKSGQYVYSTFSALGCDSTVTLNLTMVDYPTLEIADSGNYCNDGKATLKAITNGNYVTWYAFPADSSLIGQEHNPTIYVSPTEYTIYTVVADSLYRPKQCTVSATRALNKASVLTARVLASSDMISVGSNPYKFTDISRGEVEHRRWYFYEDNFDRFKTTVLNDSVVRYSIADNTDSLMVRLVVSNSSGCADSVDKILRVLEGDLWVPNAFTPNSDKNNLFVVKGYNVTNYEITIYNRSGLVAFHSTDLAESWDGTYNGKPCVEGSYVYVIYYGTKSSSSKLTKKVGSVLLLR